MICQTIRALGRAHLPLTKVFYKTILKLRLALEARRQYVYVGFSRRKIARNSAARWQPRQGCKVP